jgi:hypothetical protein
MVFGALFLNLKRAKQPLLRAAGCHTRPSKLNFQEKCAKLPLPFAAVSHTRLDEQHCPQRTYHSVFFKGGEEDKISHLFLMNKKGLLRVYFETKNC